MNYWPRWIGSIQKKTAHLSLAEMGAYDRLLDHYYAQERALPADVERCYRIAGASSAAERKAVDAVLAEFFVLGEQGHTQERADEEISQAQPKINAARTNGARGGRPRKNPEKTQRVSDGNPSGTQSESSTTSEEIHNPPASQAPPGGKPRGERLPAGWEPGSEGLAFAAEQGLANGRAAAEVAKFRDYWAAQPGAKGRKADWPATWRNWCRKAAEALPPKAPVSDLSAMFRRGAA